MNRCSAILENIKKMVLNTIVWNPPTKPNRSKILKTYLLAVTPFSALSNVKTKRVLLAEFVLYL